MLVYLSIEGQEKLALGQVPSAWNYHVLSAAPTYEHDSVLVGSFEPDLPSREACMEPVLKGLKAKEDKIHAEAFVELQAVKERREKLLCLTSDVSTTPKADYDIPF